MPTTISGTSGVSQVQDGAIQSVDFATTAQLPLGNSANSMVRLNTAAGYGSTNTRIVRFTNVVTNQGTDITYAASATLGDTFTINTNGVYAINYTAVLGAGSVQGVSLNSTQLTTSIAAITQTDVLTMDGTTISGAYLGCATTVYLTSGSVIRAHGDGSGFNGTNQYFTITRVA